MKTMIMIVVRTAVILGLLAAGFALGFPIGQNKGFNTGSEWGIVQADIAAREAGSPLIVSMEEGQIRVIVTQPRGLYKRAQQQAALYSDRIAVAKAGTMDVPVGIEPED
jgi:hypothetical protein